MWTCREGCSYFSSTRMDTNPTNTFLFLQQLTGSKSESILFYRQLVSRSLDPLKLSSFPLNAYFKTIKLDFWLALLPTPITRKIQTELCSNKNENTHTHNPNQPDSILAQEACIVIQSDLRQGWSPLTELSFTSEGVIEWRTINEGIHKGNHQTALAI